MKNPPIGLLQTGLICVTLGLALNDKTWIEQDVTFRLDLEWESYGSTFELADKAMDNFCDQAVKNRDSKTSYEIAQEAGQIRHKYEGFFLRGWNWIEEDEKPIVGTLPTGVHMVASGRGEGKSTYKKEEQ